MLDFFDAKGVVENLLNQLGLEAGFQISEDEGLFPGRAANITLSNDSIGIVGDLHPVVAQVFDLIGTVCLIELDLEKLFTRVSRVKEYQSIPRFPSVSRDIALVVDEQVDYQRIYGIVRGFPLVIQTGLFDLYSGTQIPEGKKSFALRIIYQSPNHTLTDEEVNQTQEQMLDRLHQELGAVLRS